MNSKWELQMILHWLHWIQTLKTLQKFDEIKEPLTKHIVWRVCDKAGQVMQSQRQTETSNGFKSAAHFKTIINHAHWRHSFCSNQTLFFTRANNARTYSAVKTSRCLVTSHRCITEYCDFWVPQHIFTSWHSMLMLCSATQTNYPRC